MKTIDRERTRWVCVYVARNSDGKPIADLRIFVGALKFGSEECGVKGLLRPFPSNKRGTLDLRWRFSLSSKDKISDLMWEQRIEKACTNVKIQSASNERTPSYRIQMGVFKENKNFHMKKPGKDWKLYKEWPKHVNIDGLKERLQRSIAEDEGPYKRTNCRGVAGRRRGRL